MRLGAREKLDGTDTKPDSYILFGRKVGLAHADFCRLAHVDFCRLPHAEVWTIESFSAQL